MSMDGLALFTAVQELQRLVGGKIDKIQQPEKDLLLFFVRTQGETLRLLVCSHAENGRVHFTEKSYENPQAPPAFCMLLRRRLIGGRIIGLRQADDLERILYVDIAARDELQDAVSLCLVVELMGKHGNILLLDGDETIIDCLRRVSIGGVDAGARVLLPGFRYRPPTPPDKKPLLYATKPELAALLAADDPGRVLCDAYGGLSRQSANALAARCQTPDAMLHMLAAFRAAHNTAALTDTGVLPFLPIRAHTPCDSLSKAYDAFYESRDRNIHMQRHSSSLRRAGEQALKRARNRQGVYMDALQNREKCERDHLCGEWILANLHRIHTGNTAVMIENYYADPPTRETVPLDPRLSAAENAQRYFKQYKKAKAAHTFAQAQMAAVAAEIDYLEGVLQSIALAETVTELEEIRDELVQERYVRLDKNPSVKSKPPHRVASQPLRFVSSDGVPIHVGKNNRQNERLTLREAKPNNLFLHVRNMTGSHVIVDSAGIPPERTLLEAAMLAAFYSAARGSGGVPVDYAERRFVRKCPGGRAGMVVYSNNRTICVTPDMALIEKLKQ